MGRGDRILAPLGDMGGIGLEIGALHHPVVDRKRARVLYVDHADTATLRTKYTGDPDVEGGDIVDVDVVWADGPLLEALGERGPIEWVVASHVIEHAPDLVHWLDELASVLCDGGVLSLAIPDKRYCFDINRRATDPAAVVGAWLAKRRRPTPETVYEFYARIQEVNVGMAWAGAYGASPREDNVLQGLEWAQRAGQSEDYTDVHCWAFTPASFVATLHTLFVIGLSSFRVVSFAATAPGELEFYCALERVPREVDDVTRQRVQLESLTRLDVHAEPERARDLEAENGSVVRAIPLSRLEERAIHAKRYVLTRARGLLRRPGRNR